MKPPENITEYGDGESAREVLEEPDITTPTTPQ